jgi:CRISPR system Cascade subunit CasC
MSDDITAEKAEKMAITALTNAGLKVKEKKGNSVDALFFISHVQADKLAELAVTGEKDKNLYKIALKENPSIDIALFGRMVASDPEMNYDAAAQVAHSISTHAVQTEYDYFTAVDDCSPEDNAGAGHLGTMEFNSATLYRYATVNVSELYKNIGVEDAANAVKGFAEAFIRSMPTGKQNSYANGTLPDTVYVTVRNDQPVNLCGAFEKPIYSNCGYAEKSAEELFKYADRVYENFCGKPTCSFVIGNADNSDIGKVNLNELLDALYDYIANGVV